MSQGILTVCDQVSQTSHSGEVVPWQRMREKTSSPRSAWCSTPSCCGTRLSPLIDSHLNVHGRYTFTEPTGDGLRPLRDLTEPPEAEYRVFRLGRDRGLIRAAACRVR